MKLSHLALAAAVAALSSTNPGWAQSTGTKSAPAEFPPAGFKGMQYVDSRGCVYIRAGVDGNVSWIPRLTRKRKHICNMQPTAVAGTTKAPPASQRREVVQITLEPETPATAVAVSAAPKILKPTTRRVSPQATRVAASQPKPKLKPVARAVKPTTQQASVAIQPVRKPTKLSSLFKKRERTVQAVPVPNKPIVLVPEAPRTVQIPAPSRTPATPVRTGQDRRVASTVTVPQGTTATCSQTSVASQPYIKTTSNYPFRCGPQAPGGFARSAPNDAPSLANGTRRAATLGAPVPSTSLPGNTRVVPLHVAKQRAGVGAFTVPQGYRAAWEDDRLNPHRAEGTLDGRDRMNLVWTNTVPRRLIVADTGRDVTAKVALVYPFTDIAVQRQTLGEVTLITRNGQTMKRVLRKSGAPSVAELASKKRAAKRVKPVVATRSVAPKTPSAAGERIQGKRYVQVGTFGVQTNAQATASRMKRIGMPVRIGKFSKSGQTMRIVLAGPFVDNKAAERALRTVRQAGYGDAFLRK